VLSFFAQEQESRVLCYANANLTRRDQAGEAMLCRVLARDHKH
jgi:hypothetical protein